ncbi:hypothetical protein DYB38_011610 [Aphanomyces astaci]|uniref:AraC effector-binding domain-containing protein n=1 Tax=Aphanomyces astaci TaxID=112090 RepID=A0A397E0M1_APHAT|nr:hypothetical protein DYB38_011610 [Aphanomyces astaci]
MTDPLSHRIEHGPKRFVAGFQARIPVGPSPIILSLWEQLRSTVSLTGKQAYGVYRDFNADVYTYVAAVDVDEDAALPDGWVAVEIPAHDFAVYDHRGPLATIGDHWNAIATSGQVTHDYSVPSMEVYPPDFKEGHALTLWLPIVTSAT